MDWLRHFLDEYQTTIAGSPDIQLSASGDDVTILFDPEHLRRILGNLLDNALRHSEIATGAASAEIVMTWEHLAQRCVIDVIDHGLGVPTAEQAKLFEPFYTTVEKGTGLGLYMCKELCEINKATLVYRRTRSGKSCFRITISHQF